MSLPSVCGDIASIPQPNALRWVMGAARISCRRVYLDETVSVDELSLRSSVADPGYTTEASFVYTAHVRHRQDLCLAKQYGELFTYMLRSGESIYFPIVTIH
jgi:hypothetical protein